MRRTHCQISVGADAPLAPFLLFDPSRRQQANFLRKKLEGEKFEKSESEEVLRKKKDITSVREHTKKNLVEVDENGGAGELKKFEKLSQWD